MTPITAGTWRAGSLVRSTADWPFDWVAEITTIDPATQSHRYLATIHQSGARGFDEARTNVRAMARAPQMLMLLHHVAHVLDMSDPDHPVFADSAADCLEALLAHDAALRALLADLAPQHAASSALIQS